MIAPQQRNGNVLVADTNPIYVEVVYNTLSSEFDVYYAPNVDKVLSLCENVDFDLIILDINLVGRSGLEVCKTLKAHPQTRNIPVIFITSIDNADYEIACWNAGCVDFVTKPINQVTLWYRAKAHIKLKQQADFLKRSALTDGLTGIPNRSYFDQESEKEWRRCRRAGLYCTIALIDIDYFKPFNDYYGHLGGDECLKLVAKTLESSLNRPGDICARYGGEEFGLVLPGGTREADEMVINRLLEKVRELKIEHGASQNQPCVTISAGAYGCVPSDKTTLKYALELADQMLYKAKEKGRNRLEIYKD